MKSSHLPDKLEGSTRGREICPEDFSPSVSGGSGELTAGHGCLEARQAGKAEAEASQNLIPAGTQGVDPGPATCGRGSHHPKGGPSPNLGVHPGAVPRPAGNTTFSSRGEHARPGDFSLRVKFQVQIQETPGAFGIHENPVLASQDQLQQPRPCVFV